MTGTELKQRACFVQDQSVVLCSIELGLVEVWSRRRLPKGMWVEKQDIKVNDSWDIAAPTPPPKAQGWVPENRKSAGRWCLLSMACMALAKSLKLWWPAQDQHKNKLTRSVNIPPGSAKCTTNQQQTQRGNERQTGIVWGLLSRAGVESLEWVWSRYVSYVWNN